ncbi:hypothetical protein PANI_CDS0025 [Maribacter phage Panino]
MEQHEFILEENVPITLNKFNRLFDQLMSRTWEYNGMFYNLKELGWKWGYSNKKRSLGSCSYNSMTGQGKVTISKKLLTLNLHKNPKDFEDTIRHEIAHAIDFMIRNKSGHDVPWKKIASHLGAIPETGKKKINNLEPKWRGVCPSGHIFKKHRLTSSAKRGSCSKCCGCYNPEFRIKWSKNY